MYGGRVFTRQVSHLIHHEDLPLDVRINDRRAFPVATAFFFLEDGPVDDTLHFSDLLVHARLTEGCDGQVDV